MVIAEMLYDVFRMLSNIMHSADFWTREQILCAGKVDGTKAMWVVKALCPLAYLTKQTEAEKLNPHTLTWTFPTMRFHNSTFQGKDADHAICRSQFCCPRAVTSGERFLSLVKSHFVLQ